AVARATVLLLWLGFLTTSASAECAWVLWATNRDKGDASAIPVNGYTALRECQREQTSWENREASYQRQRASQPPGKPALPSVAVSYRCLPDTVDPRGPKG